MIINDTPLARTVIGCAIEVHRELGPGLLESAYHPAFADELTAHGVRFQREVAVPLLYKGRPLDCQFRLDFLIEDNLVVELKAQDVVLPVHSAQVLTYMKLRRIPFGLLINFNVTRLKEGGIKSLVLKDHVSSQSHEVLS